MDNGAGKGPGLETIRALHQTVVALRTALEQSKSEILELKSKVWPLESVQEALTVLSIENHILRQKLSNNKPGDSVDTEEIKLEQPKEEIKQIEIKENAKNIDEELEFKKIKDDSQSSQRETERENLKTNQTELNKPLKTKKVTLVSPKLQSERSLRKFEAKISIKTETTTSDNKSKSLESLTVIKASKNKKLSFSKTISVSNLLSSEAKVKMADRRDKFRHSSEDLTEERDLESGSIPNDLDQNDEVDDIELIFTTDDTKDSDFKEQLVSIEAGDSIQEASNLLMPLSEGDQILDVSDRELDDDVFNDNFENENQENDNFQSFDLKRDNSRLRNSKSDVSVNQDRSLKSYCSLQDSSFENRSLEKDESFDRFEERVRIVETDISKCGIQDVEYVTERRNTCPNPLQYRPLLHREAISKGLVVGRKIRPILMQSNADRKESGAQTDISALPESSWRSESSLAGKARLGDNFTTLPSKYPMHGGLLRLSEKTVEARRVLLSDIGFTSMVPELSRSADHLFSDNPKLAVQHNPTYGQFLRTTDLYSPSCSSRKFNWSAASPSEGSQCQSRYGSTYPITSPRPSSRRCSAPVSPSRRIFSKGSSARVRFANGSLPELRTDWNVTLDSGDSTDSLVEEAENYLRRSIDCIMIGRDGVPSSYGDCKKTVRRRASAPEPSRDNVPPNGWQPFLPRMPRDLKLDHWVKVITPEGRVRGGRVRYVGPVAAQTEQFVGVQLSNPDGYCDGSYNSRRYFQCEPYHGIFVPFKKVIMGWRP